MQILAATPASSPLVPPFKGRSCECNQETDKVVIMQSSRQEGIQLPLSVYAPLDTHPKNRRVLIWIGRNHESDPGT